MPLKDRIRDYAIGDSLIDAHDGVRRLKERFAIKSHIRLDCGDPVAVVTAALKAQGVDRLVHNKILYVVGRSGPVGADLVCMASWDGRRLIVLELSDGEE